MDHLELSLQNLTRGAAAAAGLLGVYHVLYLWGRLDRFLAGAV
jgi:hypothetical protein